MRPIDADALVERIMGEPPDAHYPSYYADMVDKAPTIDAAPSEQKQHHENLKIINRLAELVRLDSGEMTAVEFLNVRDEMTAGTHKDRVSVIKSIFQSGHDNELAVEIVRKWKEEQS